MPISFNYSLAADQGGGAKTVMMEAMASQAILQNIIYKRKKGFPLPTHNFIKPLYQAVSALLPTGNSARTAYLHCIKLGTNIDPPYNTGNDFIYNDDFKDNVKNYKYKTEQSMNVNVNHKSSHKPVKY